MGKGSAMVTPSRAASSSTMRLKKPPCGTSSHRIDSALVEDLVAERNAEGSDRLVRGKRRNEPGLGTSAVVLMPLS